jgi:hypothetical protein
VSLFDQLVNEALRSRAELSSLRTVVEKELLHHDILRDQPDRRMEFTQEMQRFLPVATVRDTIGKSAYWQYLLEVVNDMVHKAVQALT